MQKEKAKELIEKFKIALSRSDSTRSEIRQCAIIAVDLHLEELSKMKLIFSDRLHLKFWNEVKHEIQKL